MSTAKLVISKAGGRINLQDQGRWRHQSLGIGPGGAADRYASTWANKLLDNPLSCSVLEICLGNCELHFEKTCRIALTGADSNARLNGRHINTWSTIKVPANSRLTLSLPLSGLYTYLSISGGFIAPTVLSSSAMNTREKIGPYRGDFLEAHDILVYEENLDTLINNRSVDRQVIPNYSDSATLRLIPSSSLPFKIITTLENKDYTISPDSNKMGVRLKGEELDAPAIQQHNRYLYSRGMTAGCIQILPNGQPVVLLSEHQTIGGYPLLGCVYAADLHRLAQRRPGQKIQFKIGSLEEALKEKEKLDFDLD